VKRPGNSAANIDLVHSCMHTRFHNSHSSRSRHNIPLFLFQSPAHSSRFLVHNLISSPFVAYALFAKDTGRTPVRVALLNLQLLARLFVRNFQRRMVNCYLRLPATPLFPPLTNSLPVSPLLAALTKMRGKAPSHLDISYNLRFALLALGPTAR
jgi:hypothetical protein